MDVVIVAYRCYDELERCLHSIEKTDDQGVIKSVVVVDNSPSQGYWDAWRGRRWPTRVIQNKYNKGFGAAANQGIKVCKARYVALLNPDCVVECSAFREAVSFLDQNSEIAVLGPRILEAGGGGVQGSARTFPRASTIFFGRSSILTRLFPQNKFVKRNMPCFSVAWKANECISVDWVSGAAMFLRRQVVEDVKLFDESFFMYWEDADLCRRVREADWQVVYYPRPTVIHEVGRSSRHHPWRRELQFHKSALMLLKKEHGGVAWRTIFAANLLGTRMFLRLAMLSLENIVRRNTPSNT